LTETLAPLAPTAATFRVIRTQEGTELYFPKLRMPEVSLALGAFGVIGTALTGLTLLALLPSALATPAGLLTSVLLASFVAPFMLLGLASIFTAIYMVSNTLHVRVTTGSIQTERIIFGAIVKRARVERSAVTAIEPEIASRYQNIFSSTPVYQLIATSAGGGRIVVAETLKGDAVMHYVQRLIENPSGADLSAPGTNT
jgi:hypothetical protein